MTQPGIAHVIHEAETLPRAAFDVSVAAALAAVRDLCEPDVLYKIAFDDLSGELLQRFSRTLEFEAWLVAQPVDDIGTRRRDKKPIVCPILFILPDAYERRRDFGDALVAELNALLAA